MRPSNGTASPSYAAALVAAAALLSACPTARRGLSCAGVAPVAPSATEPIVEIANQRGRRLAFAPDGETWVFAEAMDGAVYRDATLLKRLRSPGYWLTQIAFAPDQRTLALGPYRYDLTTEAFAEPPGLPSALVEGVALHQGDGFVVDIASFSPDGGLLVVGSTRAPSGGLDRGEPPYLGHTGRLLAVDGRTGALVRMLHQGASYEVPRVLLVGDRFVVAGGDMLRVFSRPGLAKIAEAKPPGRTSLFVLSLSHDGSLLAGGTADGEIAVWRFPSLDLQRSWTGHTGSVNGLAFRGDARPPVLASGGEDGRIRWFALDGALLREDVQSGPVEGLALSPRGDRMLVAVGGAVPTIRLLRLSSPPPR